MITSKLTIAHDDAEVYSATGWEAMVNVTGTVDLLPRICGAAVTGYLCRLSRFHPDRGPFRTHAHEKINYRFEVEFATIV